MSIVVHDYYLVWGHHGLQWKSQAILRQKTSLSQKIKNNKNTKFQIIGGFEPTDGGLLLWKTVQINLYVREINLPCDSHCSCEL